MAVEAGIKWASEGHRDGDGECPVDLRVPFFPGSSGVLAVRGRAPRDDSSNHYMFIQRQDTAVPPCTERHPRMDKDVCLFNFV